VPLVSPVIVVLMAGGLPVIVVAVCAVVPTNGVIVYEVMPLPLFAGAVHDTVADALPAVAATPAGVPGAVAGVTELDAADDGDAPTAFVAVTVNVYAVPFVNPLTVALVPLEVVAVCAADPTKGVTVYDVIGLPPLAGAVQETVAEPLPAVAETPVGTPGTAAGVTELDAADGDPVPTAFVAVTVNVYAVPFVNPSIVAFVPVAVVGAWAVDPMNGVTVYRVIWLPPSAGAVQDTVADPLPASAVTPVGAAGAVAVRPPDGTTNSTSTKKSSPVEFDGKTSG
jgi:hypothetical protein